MAFARAEIVNGTSYLDGVTATASSAGQGRVASQALGRTGAIGLNPLTSECYPDGSMAWMGDATDPKPWISFDLGAKRNLAFLHVWKYNEAGYNQSRTIKTAEIFTSADTTPTWVSRGKYTFAEAPGTYGYLGEDIPFPFAEVRMVKVQALATGGDEFHGLSKVRFVCAGLLSFGLPGMPAPITGTAITWKVPSSMNVKKLAPTFTLSSGTTAEPVSGTARDFTTPQTYTVKATLDKPVTTVYAVTTKRAAARPDKDFETFGFLPCQPVLLFGTDITLTPPNDTAVTALAPTFTVSPGASAVPASGTTRNFTTTQEYTVTAEDGTSKYYIVKAGKATTPWVTTQGAWKERVPAAGERPVNHQFYARGANNEGTLHYNGTSDGAADTVFLKVYADDKLCDTQHLKLKPDKRYNFAAKLKPELVRYKVE